eukprot:CAMPEP_0201884848 /NCGR_PEP_ID=MMETSP0902-20130614/17586_1 /ASSEMBLY_ACC=CAM_ASM_000551 /TAXON_ID=420261 /ORGANISM="Thalassiosira antarctica, Strain CCMP982" /LENGTH=231 /DNA_ID=CAMNT_0048413863 /DNA_START=124 /DNA_END=819 /DNA_ORIENTATION=+
MKFLLQLTLLAVVAASPSVYASDESSVALRGSESINSATEKRKNKSGQCVSMGPQRTREALGHFCLRVLGSDYTKPYRCDLVPNVCCQPGGSLQTEWGECTRVNGDEVEEEQMNDEISVDEATLVKDSSDSNSNESVSAHSSDEFEEKEGGLCIGTKKLSSKERGTMPTKQFCRVNYQSTGQTQPYTCTKSPGHACCQPSAGSTVSIDGLGKCTKEKPPSIEEEEGIISEA